MIANPQSPSTLTGGDQATLLLGASASATTGGSSISVQGTSGSLTHSKTITLTVQSGVAAVVSRTTRGPTHNHRWTPSRRASSPAPGVRLRESSFVRGESRAESRGDVTPARVPLGIGTIVPISGAAAGGTTVTIRGSGFQSGVTLTIGGKSAAVTFVEMNTLKIVTAALPTGAQRVVITKFRRRIGFLGRRLYR